MPRYLTSAFTPMIFMGEEWAATTPFQFFTDFEEPELAKAVTEGRRREFESHGWATGTTCRTRRRDDLPPIPAAVGRGRRG